VPLFRSFLTGIEFELKQKVVFNGAINKETSKIELIFEHQIVLKGIRGERRAVQKFGRLFCTLCCFLHEFFY